MRPKGSDGGHNGLAHINSVLGTNEYARIRFGIGNDFKRGAQRNFVLSSWNDEDKKYISERIGIVIEMIRSFGTVGMDLTMTRYNISGKEEKTKTDEGKRPGSVSDEA